MNTTDINIDVNLQLPKWMIYQNAVELVLLILIHLSALNAFIIFYKHAPFHKNLVLLILNVYIGYLLLSFTRMIICVASFYEKELLSEKTLFVRTTIFKYVEMIRVATAFYSISCITFIMIERLISTVLLASYEKSANTLLLPLSTISCWIIGAIGSYASLGSYYSLQLATIFMFFQLSFISLCFVFIWHKNSKHLRLSKRPSSSSFSLSQRYQITENIRVIKIFTRCLIVFMITMPLLVGFFTLSVFRLSETGDTIYFARSAVNIMTAIFLLLLINIAITSTHTWRRHYNQNIQLLLKCFQSKNRHFPKKKNARIFIHNTDGMQLAFNNQDANEIYFKQLKIAWT